MLYKQPSPDWKVALMASAPDISLALFIYDLSRGDPLHNGLVRLTQIGVFSKEFPFPVLLPSLPPRWNLGIMAPRHVEQPRGASRVESTDMTWALGYMWNSLHGTAWETLLKGLEQIQSPWFSMSPDLIVPVMFLTRMATLERWLDRGYDEGEMAVEAMLQDYAHRVLLPLVLALGYRWAMGPSRGAAAYRAAARTPLLFQAEQQKTLDALATLAGSQVLQRLIQAERFEPAVIRLLDQVSAQLWNQKAVVTHSPSEETLLTALLPVARWRDAPPGPERLPLDERDAPGMLLRRWKEWISAKDT